MNKAKTIDMMHELAAEHGGWCLSTTYSNNKTKLTWKCAKGHVWDATPRSVMQGRWCRTCAHESTKLTIGEMRTLAAERGGQCLSDTYVGCYVKLTFLKGFKRSKLPVEGKVSVPPVIVPRAVILSSTAPTSC